MIAADLPQLQAHDVVALLDNTAFTTPWRMTQLSGGGNNRVYRIESGSRVLVLKQYFHSADDPRDRLGAEFALTSFAWRNGVLSLPKPIAADFQRRLGLYGFVDGKRFAPGEVDGAAVDQALSFALALDGLRDSADGRTLPDGSEAVFRFGDHLALVERRVRSLGRIDVGDSLQADAALFVSQSLMPAWDRLAERVRADAARERIAIDEELPLEECTISPSDFGFHNALRTADGVVFLDFEYFGWDDPVKLVADFLHHPGMSLDAAARRRFLAGAQRAFADDPNFGLRLALMYPLYGLRWVCILLNEFLPERWKRRAYAGAADRDVALRRQLLKARAKLNDLGGLPHDA